MSEPRPISKKSLVFWTLFGVIALSAAFASTIHQNVSRVLRGVGVTDDLAFFTEAGNLAILEIEGVIDDPKETLEAIAELEENKDFKAVVVRISSPGGAVGPTQEIYNAMLRLKAQKKKLVCSLGDIAASGGYYIAAACDKIIANAGSLTGSIGVIMHFMNLKDLYSWAKVQPYIIKSGRYKDIGSESRAMTDEERKLLQDMIDDVHGQFKAAVQKGRSMKPENVETFADGRIFSGAQAKKLGFVDMLGGEFEAIEEAVKLAGIQGKPQIVRQTPKQDRLPSFFRNQALSPIFEQLLARLLPEAANPKSPALKIQPGVPYYLPAFVLR